MARIPKHQAVKANTGSGGETPYPPKTDLRNSEVEKLFLHYFRLNPDERISIFHWVGQ